MDIKQASCIPIRLEPGMRLLVQVQVPLAEEQRKALERTIRKWAGPDIPLLIIDPSIRIGIEDAGERKIRLATNS